eukprot:5551206-Alexandrium_andersonii.AAC.1
MPEDVHLALGSSRSCTVLLQEWSKTCSSSSPLNARLAHDQGRSGGTRLDPVHHEGSSQLGWN